MQAAMTTLQQQLQHALKSHLATEQDVLQAQAVIADHRQQLADAQAWIASSKAAQKDSDQSIAALQQNAAQQAAASTASEAKHQALLAELDLKDEQLKLATRKLQASDHAASQAQEAAVRLQARLTDQQTAASDESQELTQALKMGSATVHQLEVTIQALQDKVFAAEHAMESQQEQLASQKATASDAAKHVEVLDQQLIAKESLVASLQAALDSAKYMAESNQELVSTLQEKHNSKEADAGQQVASLIAQLQMQADKNAELRGDLSRAQGQLSIADHAIAAAYDEAQAANCTQSALQVKIAQLTQLLDSKERREWLAKTSVLDTEVCCRLQYCLTLERGITKSIDSTLRDFSMSVVQCRISSPSMLKAGV